MERDEEFADKLKDSPSSSDEGDELLSAISLPRDEGWIQPPGSHLSIYPVARYPENHNPLLPLSLVQRLDDLSPRDFLTSVLRDLSLEDRGTLMCDEKQRRKTFVADWPYNGNLSGIRMAQAGFYYCGDGDLVQCAFCGGKLNRWSSKHNPIGRHATEYSFCKFVKGKDCGNRVFHPQVNVLQPEHLRNITFTQAPSQTVLGDLSINAIRASLGISTTCAAFRGYASEASRLSTYSRWPYSNPVTSMSLCDAGFYYTGLDDIVQCFYCGGGIKGWAVNDDPWKEHSRWFPECGYLLDKKTESYVEMVRQTTPLGKKCVRKTKLQRRTEIEKADLAEMMKVCEKLGHSRTVIEKAVATCDIPIDSVKQLIDRVHLLEEMSEEETCVEDDVEVGRYEGCCQLCVKKRSSTVRNACHIGLPCGHLIFCDNCMSEEKKKSEHQKIRCPYPKCYCILAGLMKVYLC